MEFWVFTKYFLFSSTEKGSVSASSIKKKYTICFPNVVAPYVVWKCSGTLCPELLQMPEVSLGAICKPVEKLACSVEGKFGVVGWNKKRVKSESWTVHNI